MRGGYLGVDVFFVLSGYLITVQLLKSRPVRGAAASARFYGLFLAHRATRLLPALMVMLGTAWVVTRWLPIDRSHVGACTARAATYTMNLPGAEPLHCPAIWHISWSLAAEVQFYTLWPVGLLGLMWVSRRLAASTLWAAASLVASLFALALGWDLWVWSQPGGKQHFLFAPDGRSLIILVGCGIALLLGRPSARTAVSGCVRSRATGVAALLTLAVAFGLGRSTGAMPAVGYYLMVGVATSVLLAQAVSAVPAGVPAMLVHPVTTWLGRISYSLYLWHEIAYATARLVPLHNKWSTDALGVALAVLAAAASYRWVEQPALRGLRRVLPRQDKVRSPGAKPLVPSHAVAEPVAA
jgi:peptidoglycan/LPS O-acetylase OafA/YrhL